MNSDFMKTDEVAKRLGVSRRRVSQLVSEGSIPYLKRGRIVVVPVGAWEQWIAEQNRLAMSALKGEAHAEAA